MFKGIEVVCFFSCYVVVFLLELARVRFKTVKALSLASFVMLSLGAFAHAAFLYHRDLLQNDRVFVNASDWFYVSAFAATLTLVYLTFVYSRTQFSLFLLPLVFALIGWGIAVGDAHFSTAATHRYVRGAHGISLLLATLLSYLGAISSVMYFWQNRRLKRKKLASAFPLPTLEWLNAWSRGCANGAVVALGIGVASGFYLKLFAVGGTAEGGASTDYVALAASACFFGALASRLWIRTQHGSSDASAHTAAHNIVCSLALTLLLFFAAFSPSGHWRQLTNRGDSETPISIEASPNSSP